jgi:hypothetical protein
MLSDAPLQVLAVAVIWAELSAVEVWPAPSVGGDSALTSFRGCQQRNARVRAELGRSLLDGDLDGRACADGATEIEDV